jgi:hypothetical protein
MEFIRRFLQHVLPTGFMKVRYYGFMNPTARSLWIVFVPSSKSATASPLIYPNPMSSPVVPIPVQAAAVLSDCAPYCCLPELCGRIGGNSIKPKLISVAFPVRCNSKGCADVRPHREQMSLPTLPIPRCPARKKLTLSHNHHCKFTARRFIQ